MNQPQTTASGGTPPVGSITTAAQASAAGAYDATHGSGAYHTYIIANKRAPTGTSDMPPQASNPDTPSSSSYLPTSGNIATATTNATTPTPPVAPVNENEQALMEYYHTDLDTIRAQFPDAFSIADAATPIREKNQAQIKAQEDANAQRAAQVQASAAANAKEDATYGALMSKINLQLNAALQSSKAANAASDPFGATSSADSGRIAAIGAPYIALMENANNQYSAAKAALVAGDATTYASIMKQLDANIADYGKTAAGQLSTHASQAQQTKYQNATLDLATQTKNQGIADKELQTITGESADAILALPNDVSKFTPAQMATLSGTPGYNSLIAAGLSPADALGYIKNAATGNKQQQAEQKINIAQANSAIAASRAQAYLLSAQAKLVDKQASAMDAQIVGGVANGVFLDAATGISPDLTKQQNSALLSSLSYFAQGNNVNGMKTTLLNAVLKGLPPAQASTISGLQATSDAAQSLMNKIKALPANQQTGFLSGNAQAIATKFGQNPDPKLQEIAAEFTHLNKLYAANVFGKRAVTSGDPSLASILGSSKDSKSLNISDITAFTNTFNDYLGGMVKSKIGGSTYESIYGSGSSNTAGGTTLMTGPDGKSYNVPNQNVAAFRAAGGK